MRRSQTWWRFIRQHPRTVAFAWPVVMILAAGLVALVWLWGGTSSSNSTTTSSTTNQVTTTTGLEPVNPGWFDQLGIGDGVTIQVNAYEFGAGEIVESAVTNGTAEPIYFLSGCIIREVERPIAGAPQTFPTAQVVCDALPTCEEIGPQSAKRFFDWDQTIAKDGAESLVRESGLYRLLLTYGTGCENGALIGSTTISSEELTVR